MKPSTLTLRLKGWDTFLPVSNFRSLKLTIGRRRIRSRSFIPSQGGSMTITPLIWVVGRISLGIFTSGR